MDLTTNLKIKQTKKKMKKKLNKKSTACVQETLFDLWLTFELNWQQTNNKKKN